MSQTHEAVRNSPPRRPIAAVLQVACWSLMLFADWVPAQEATAAHEPIELRSLFADDFLADSRNSYELSGEVAWQAGSLTLAPFAEISRSIESGPWIRVAVDFEVPADAETKLAFAVRFHLEGETDFLVGWTRAAGGQDGARLGVVDTIPSSDGTEKLVAVRGWDLNQLQAGVWTIEYRNGTIVIESPAGESRRIYSASISNGPANIHSVTVRGAAVPVKLKQLTVQGTARIAPYTPKQKRLLDEVDELQRNCLDLIYQGRKAEAEANLIRARELIRKEIGTENADFALSLNMLGLFYNEVGEFDKAESNYIQAKDLFKQVLGENHRRYALGCNNLGIFYLDSGQLEKVEPLLQQACEISERLLGAESSMYATFLSNLGRYYYQTFDLARAEPCWETAAKIRERVVGPDHTDYAVSLNNLGNLYGSLGEYVQAERYHLEALAIRERKLGEDHPDYVQSLINLAYLYYTLGDFARAEPMMLKARVIQKRILGTDSPQYVDIITSLATLYSESGNDERAEAFFLEGHEIIRRVLGTRHLRYASSLNELALFYARFKDDYATSERMLREAKDIREQLLGRNNEHYCWSLDYLAGHQTELGKYEEAEALYREAADIAKRVLGTDHHFYAWILSDFARMYETQGDYAAAAPLLEEAIQVLLNAANRVVSTQSEAQAMNWLSQNGPMVGRWLANMRRQESSDARVAYQVVWRTKSLATRLRVNQTLDSAATADARHTFDDLQHARLELARLATSAPQDQPTDVRQAALRRVNDRKEELEKRLAAQNPASRRAIEIRDADIDQLAALLPGDVAIVDFSLSDDWRVTERPVHYASSDGTAENRTARDREVVSVYDAFVLRPGTEGSRARVAWVPLGDAEPINAAVKSWRATITGEKSADGGDPNPAQVLREQVWEKLEPYLADCHTVIVIPDGELHRVPWAALPGRETSSYLVEDYALATATYGQQLFGVLTDTQPGGDQLLLTGGVNYSQRDTAQLVPQGEPMGDSTVEPGNPSANASEQPSTWTYLPGTAREIETIGGAWHGGAHVRLSEARATEGSVIQNLSASRYAHLATHGFFASADSKSMFASHSLERSAADRSEANQAGASVAGRNPLLLSGLVLAGANLPAQRDSSGFVIGDDGILTAEEIAGLNLKQTELVTLSACETGLGNVAAGEGVFGLQRAFHQAGARAVVASLWKVEDFATEELMRTFYTNLWGKGLSKVEALREAQLAMIRGYDPKAGVIRGLASASIKIDRKSAEGDQLDPFYWAAFQLSGDWR